MSTHTATQTRDYFETLSVEAQWQRAIAELRTGATLFNLEDLFDAFESQIDISIEDPSADRIVNAQEFALRKFGLALR